MAAPAFSKTGPTHVRAARDPCDFHSHPVHVPNYIGVASPLLQPLE